MGVAGMTDLKGWPRLRGEQASGLGFGGELFELGPEGVVFGALALDEARRDAGLCVAGAQVVMGAAEAEAGGLGQLAARRTFYRVPIDH